MAVIGERVLYAMEADGMPTIERPAIIVGVADPNVGALDLQVLTNGPADDPYLDAEARLGHGLVRRPAVPPCPGAQTAVPGTWRWPEGHRFAPKPTRPATFEDIVALMGGNEEAARKAIESGEILLEGHEPKPPPLPPATEAAIAEVAEAHGHVATDPTPEA